MVELDDAMRRALLAREDPPSEARDAILASLRTRLGGPSDPGSGSEPPDGFGPAASPASAGARMAWAAKIVAATAGLTAGGLLTLKLGAMAMGGSASDGDRHETRVEIVEPKPLAQPLEQRAEPSPPTRVVREEPASPATSLAAEPTSASEPSDEASTLAAELALVRAAKQARAEDPDDALAQLELHRERFAKGVLAPEREALRVELLCELGRHAEAESARERFLVDFAGSPLRGRVIASCSNAGTDPRPAGD